MMMFLAENLREVMAELGFKTVDEMVGHGENLQARFVAKGKAKSLDHSRMIGHEIGIERKVVDPFYENVNGKDLDSFAKGAIEAKQAVTVSQSINNVNRSVGTRMAGWIAERLEL